MFFSSNFSRSGQIGIRHASLMKQWYIHCVRETETFLIIKSSACKLSPSAVKISLRWSICSTNTNTTAHVYYSSNYNHYLFCYWCYSYITTTPSAAAILLQVELEHPQPPSHVPFTPLPQQLLPHTTAPTPSNPKIPQNWLGGPFFRTWWMGGGASS